MEHAWDPAPVDLDLMQFHFQVPTGQKTRLLFCLVLALNSHLLFSLYSL
jgi:hypothetical protein